jgi:hypothetical protein
MGLSGLDPWNVDSNWTEAAFDEWLPCETVTSTYIRTQTCDVETVADLYRNCEIGSEQNSVNIRDLGIGRLFIVASLHPVVEQVLHI